MLLAVEFGLVPYKLQAGRCSQDCSLAPFLSAFTSSLESKFNNKLFKLVFVVARTWTGMWLCCAGDGEVVSTFSTMTMVFYKTVILVSDNIRYSRYFRSVLGWQQTFLSIWCIFYPPNYRKVCPVKICTIVVFTFLHNVYSYPAFSKMYTFILLANKSVILSACHIRGNVNIRCFISR